MSPMGHGYDGRSLLNYLVYDGLWMFMGGLKFLFLLPDLLGVCRVHEVSGGLEGFIGAELYSLLGTIMHDPLWAVDWGLPRNAGLTWFDDNVNDHFNIGKKSKPMNIYGIQFLETCIARCLVGQRANEGAGPPIGSSFFGFNLRTWTCTFARRPLRIRPGPRGSKCSFLNSRDLWEAKGLAKMEFLAQDVYTKFIVVHYGTLIVLVPS